MSYTTYSGKLKTNSNIDWHRPQSNIARVEDELMEKCRRAVTHTTDLVEKMRLLCLSQGAAGIMALGRVFRNLDVDGSKQLNRDEFKIGIKKTGLGLSEQEVDELFDKFNVYKSGSICLEEFLRQVRPPMSESRRAIVEQAFKKLDKAGDGLVTVDEIRAVYDVQANPRYMSGEDSASTTMDELLAHFEQAGIVDGKVTLEEFMNYYSGISVSIEDDCYFDLMMRQMYKL